MSDRADVAERILEYCEENHINFFGESAPKQSPDKRYYGFLIGKPRILDGLVRVYSPKFILIQLQGPLTKYGAYDAVYESEENALAFLKALCVDYDHEAAYAVPTKERK